MSEQGGLGSELIQVVELDDPAADQQIVECTKLQESNDFEEKNEIKDEENNDDLKEEEEEEGKEEVTSSTILEPSTSPHIGDKRPHVENNDGAWAEKRAPEPEESNSGISGGSQDFSEEEIQDECDRKSKAKWRESLPEGERWRDDEIEVQQDYNQNNMLANKWEEVEKTTWITEKSTLGFTPQVMIVHPPTKGISEESRHFIEKDTAKEPQMQTGHSAGQFYPEWKEHDDKHYMCDPLCIEKLRLALSTVAAGLLFPLLVWGGYAFLPFDSPLLESPPLRVVYTLRCAFFATIPILLGVLVQGFTRLHFSSLSPLYQIKLVNREVAVHWHYVNESLGLFLFYFLQLAVMATYISQDLVKLVPLLTIIFVLGRLIYWLCLCLDSSIRGLGFGLSFFPILVMLGTNLYYVCSSVGEGAVFDVAPPTTAPPPRQRWWG
ncbi:Transmembrane protein 79 Mattrin [Channa argus]|uniref:Transmembrane protein 79 Mattrin n=1 Tax=Channa argus TaxID=215402 RepID=A0A6G1QYQ7_CHAAH|nr:Transmembrane protein 79 Mattrin [Channa argus]KAK2920995.1 hypothetical protein Q8A73_000480 [Channa argus]